jgi:hypothetical protein
MNIDQQIIAGVRFLYKEKPYQVIVKTETKLNGKWIPCVVYKTLYSQGADRPIGRVYVRNEADDEWPQFVEAILEWCDKVFNFDAFVKQMKP